MENGRRHSSNFQKPAGHDVCFKVLKLLRYDETALLGWSDCIHTGYNLAQEPIYYSGWRGVLKVSLEGSSTGGMTKEMFVDTLINIVSGSRDEGVPASYNIYLLASDFKKMAYNEMISDFIKGKNIKTSRIEEVLFVSKEYIDWNSDVFLKMIDRACEASSVFAINFSKLMLEDKVIDVNKCIKKIKI